MFEIESSQLALFEGARQGYKAVRGENGRGPPENIEQIEVFGRERQGQGDPAYGTRTQHLHWL